MRVAHAFDCRSLPHLPALALSGCMRPSGPVVMAQPQADLDSMAYDTANRTILRRPWLPPVIRRRHRALRARARHQVIPTRRSRWSMRQRRSGGHDAAYHLDAGDKLRVVVYGPGRRPHQHLRHRAGGSITMPLIGSVPARGRTGAPCRRHYSQAAQRLYPRTVGGGGSRILSAILYPR